MWTSATSTIWRADRIKAGTCPAQGPACRGQSALQPGFALKPTSSQLPVVPSCSFANSQGQWTDPEAACPEEGWGVREGMGAVARVGKMKPVPCRTVGTPWLWGPSAQQNQQTSGWVFLTFCIWHLCCQPDAVRGRQAGASVSSCWALVLGPARWEQ